MSTTEIGIDVPAVGLNRMRFPGLADGWVRADAPGGTQPVDSCVAAMSEFMSSGQSANVHGAFRASHDTDRVVAQARVKVAALLGGEPEGVVFGPSMTALTFRFARAVAKTLRPGDRVVSTMLEHDSNLRPWQQAARAAGAEFSLIGLDDSSLDLDVASVAATIDDRTRWVSVSAASNTTGVVPDLAAVIEAAHRVGAHVYVDAVHAAAHGGLDRRALGASVIACSSYKWFGPHLGILCADPVVLDELEPDKLLPAPDTVPEKWELGTLPFESLAGVCASVDYLEETGISTIAAHDQGLAGMLHGGLAAVEGVTVYGAARQHTPTAFFSIAGRTPDDVARGLAKHRVAATSGNLYALELSRAIGLGDEGAARLGFVHYSGQDDVHRALAAIEAMARS